MAAQDEAALANMKDRSSKERTKGLAVTHQKQLWEKHLQLRILLQKCLASANRLPSGPDYQAAIGSDTSLAHGYEHLVQSACETIDSLLDLHSVLLQQHPAAHQSAEAVEAEANSRSKRKRRAGEEEEREGRQSAAKWQCIEEEYAKMVPFRDASVDR